jgi:hypothetical protein
LNLGQVVRELETIRKTTEELYLYVCASGVPARRIRASLERRIAALDKAIDLAVKAAPNYP